MVSEVIKYDQNRGKSILTKIPKDLMNLIHQNLHQNCIELNSFQINFINTIIISVILNDINMVNRIAKNSTDCYFFMRNYINILLPKK
jgi:hypothetical protein